MRNRSMCWWGGAIVWMLTLGFFAATVSAGEYKWPKQYIIGTSGMGSTGYAMNVALSTAVEEDSGMKCRIMPEDNLAVRARLLKAGKVDSVGGEGGMAAEILMATGGYATKDGGPFAIRDFYPTMATSLAVGFFTSGKSDIKSIWDIKKGVRIANFTAVPAMMKSYKALLAWVGLKEEDAVFVPFGGYAASMRSISQGKADIAFGQPVSPIILELESAPGGIRWIDMNPNASDKDKQGAERFREYLPTWYFCQNQMGVESAKGFWGMTSLAGNFVTADADVDLVYSLTKWTLESYDTIKTKHKMLFFKSPAAFKAAITKSFIPLHEGAIRYAKEIGAWSPAEEQRQKYNVWLVDQYINAYDKALAKAKADKIKIAYSDEKWIELWEGMKKDLPAIAVMPDEEIAKAVDKYNL